MRVELDMNTELTDLEIEQEAFHNIHKAVFGFRPRYGTDEQWNDIEWLRQQILFIQINYPNE